MKKLFLVILGLILFSFNSFSDNLKVAWDYDDLAIIQSFRVSWSEVSGDYSNITNSVEVLKPQLEATLTQLKGSTQYYIVVSAIDIAGLESDKSNEITYKTSVPAPYNLRIVTE